MQKTVGLFILEILPFVLDCKLSFFLLRPFTGRTENVCISSVTVQKENHHLCIASKRENKKREKKPFEFHVPISRHSTRTFVVLDSRLEFSNVSINNWHTHKNECNYYSSCWSLPSLSISLSLCEFI